MEKKLKEELEKKLKKELEELENQMKDLGVYEKDINRWATTPVIEEIGSLPADESEIADHFEDFEERSSLLKELEKRYNKIKEALKRINTKEYGICKVCKKPIEIKRLKIEPLAETCIKHRETKV